MEAAEPADSYVDMTSPTAVVSNPEYFSDIVSGSPDIISGHSRDIGRPRKTPSENYYNCPPPPKPPANSMWSSPPAAVHRQTSQV